MTYPPPPLSDAQRDALIRKMTDQLRVAEQTIRDLSDELVEAHKQLAALKAGAFPEVPFVA